MKIALKNNGTNRFTVYEIKDDDTRVCLGQYAGSIATVRRLVSTKHGCHVDVIRFNSKGWY
jgi:hypothetical protein